MLRHRLVVNDGTDAGQELAELVRRLADRGGLTQGQAYRLRLAADEITTNIANHGYRGATGTVELRGDVDGDRVWLCIEDRAIPFDPYEHHPDPRLLSAPSVREPGGLGLHLALSAVDELRYQRSSDRNRNTLVMLRPDAAIQQRSNE
jgi:serine/threonine-protein kinase RsbW